MKRRNFILSLAAIGTIAVSVESCNTASAPAMLAELCDKKTLHEIGATYLQQHPQENNRESLRKLIMNKQAQDDFRDGNIVVVKGWVLSVTEARQCALLTL
jgi:hypothetical protein